MLFEKIKYSVYVILIAALIAVMLFFTGCGGDSSKGPLDMDSVALASSLVKDVNYEGELLQVNIESVNSFLDIPEYREGYFFIASQATTDCFGVFEFKDAELAKAAEEAVELYFRDVADAYEKYDPEEANKVSEKSVLIRKENLLAFCVTDDNENAESIIKAAFDNAVPAEAEEDAESEDSQKEDSKENDETTETDSTQVSAPEKTYPVIVAGGDLSYSGFIGIIGNAAFEIYDYVESTAARYCEIVNYAADQLKGSANVYSMIVPTSAGITVPDAYQDQLMGSDQKTALSNLYAKLNGNVINLDLYDHLMENRDKYIYFRTDHHWTSMGAYYAYEIFCDAKGLLPISLDRRPVKDMGKFLGSFYYDTRNASLQATPDELIAYYPISNVYMTGKDSNGNDIKKEVIPDYSNYDISFKYNSFIEGDGDFRVIVNEDRQDDSSCLVVKESFGNCFAPYLADHYHTLIVMDYRYTSVNVIDYAREHGIDDVIFVNNIGMTRSSYLVGKLDTVVRG